MVRTFLALAVVAVLANVAMAQVVFNDNYANGVGGAEAVGTQSIGWFHSGTGGPTIMTVDGVTMYGASQADGLKDFNVDIAGAAGTLKAGYVWVVDVGMYSNYISSTNGNFLQSQPCISFDNFAGADAWPSQTEMAVMRNLTGGVETVAYATDSDTNQFYDGGILNAAEPTIYTADPVALKGQITNTSFMLRNNAAGNMTYAAKQGDVAVQQTTGSAAPVGQINTMMIQVFNQASYWPKDVLNLSTGTVADSSTFAASSLKTGVTSLKVQQVRASDFDTNGITDLDDGSVLLSNWQQTGKTFFSGDADGNGTVDLDDGSVLLTNWQQASDTAVGSGKGRVDASGNILLDLKGLGLYKVFVGDANHNQVAGTDFLTFDAGKSAQRTYGAGALQTNVNASTENFGQLDAGFNVTSQNASIDPNSGDVFYAGNSFERDSFVNVNLATIAGSGYTVWLQSQVTGESVYTNLLPEPATMALLAMGGMGILARRRRA